ncbi:hypothetical protein WICMUC_002492 [Wickerhamomyces mucosus]|uniref:Inner kinetochore subunit AME1 domain-containing protein n=1 Tax=Wickerhamomyces mucosus TaxID=1378264 RepID=A0A9P8TEW8_9ASCO|nr:hypothetical protein WICMUC_002492 [Wickerhamomyces mucosus]
MNREEKLQWRTRGTGRKVGEIDKFKSPIKKPIPNISSIKHLKKINKSPIKLRYSPNKSNNKSPIKSSRLIKNGINNKRNNKRESYNVIEELNSIRYDNDIQQPIDSNNLENESIDESIDQTIVDDDGNDNISDDDISNDNELDNDDDDDDYNDDDDPDQTLYTDNSTSTIQITRLPTSSTRLTFLDLIPHYLSQSIISQRSYDENIYIWNKFLKINRFEINQLIDLNMVNNYYIYKLRDFTKEKFEIRNNLFLIGEDVNKLNKDIKILRNKYHNLKSNKLINQNSIVIDNLKDNELEKEIITLDNINKLSEIVNPGFGLLNKLQTLNEKLYYIDKLIN